MSMSMIILSQEQQQQQANLALTMMSNAVFTALSLANSIFDWSLSSIAVVDRVVSVSVSSDFLNSTVFYFTIGEDFYTYRDINTVIALLTAWMYYKAIYTTFRFIRFVFINLVGIYKILEAVCVKVKSLLFVGGGIVRRCCRRSRSQSQSAFQADRRRPSDDQQNRRRDCRLHQQRVSAASSDTPFLRKISAFDENTSSTNRQQQQQQQQQQFVRNFPPKTTISTSRQQQWMESVSRIRCPPLLMLLASSNNIPVDAEFPSEAFWGRSIRSRLLLQPDLPTTTTTTAVCF